MSQSKEGRPELKLSPLDNTNAFISGSWALTSPEAGRRMLKPGFVDEFLQVHDGYAILMNTSLQWVFADNSGWKLAPGRSKKWPLGIECTADKSKTERLWFMMALWDGRMESPHVLVYVDMDAGRFEVWGHHSVFDGTAYFDFVRRWSAFAETPSNGSSGFGPVTVSRDWLLSQNFPKATNSQNEAVWVELPGPVMSVVGKVMFNLIGLIEKFLFPNLLQTLLSRMIGPMVMLEVTMSGLHDVKPEDGDISRLSVNDIATARIWRAYLQARVTHKKIKPTGRSRCALAVDVREALSCPEGAVANCVQIACAGAEIEEVLSESEAQTAGRVRRCVEQLRHRQSVHEFMGWLLSIPLHCLKTVFHTVATPGSADVGVSSWVRMYPRQIAGGSFSPLSFRALKLDTFDGLTVLTDSKTGDPNEIVALVGSHPGEYMETLKKQFEAQNCQVAVLSPLP
mmetsp:Transcript_33016/g.51474  ORF Transcript_33016/g.51474 Transcript_33016/m.51474 type:complete len:454 (+) Transcript_33016:349-1710(+)